MLPSSCGAWLEAGTLVRGLCRVAHSVRWGGFRHVPFPTMLGGPVAERRPEAMRGGFDAKLLSQQVSRYGTVVEHLAAGGTEDKPFVAIVLGRPLQHRAAVNTMNSSASLTARCASTVRTL